MLKNGETKSFFPFVIFEGYRNQYLPIMIALSQIFGENEFYLINFVFCFFRNDF